MEIRRFAVGPAQANAYLLVAGGHAVLVDPGAEPQRLLRALVDNSAALDAVWLTHADFDHVGALAAVLERHPDTPVYLHRADLPLLRAAAEQAARWGLAIDPPPTTTRNLVDGQELTLANIRARCLFTPGHTPGHIAFHFPAHYRADASGGEPRGAVADTSEEGIVLTGDTMFRGGIGRTDRPFGDGGLLLRSIREKLLTLPDATRVLPGHGPATTIGIERKSNPFLVSS